MKKNRMSWVQYLPGYDYEDMSEYSLRERIRYVNDLMRDENVGTTRLRFRVTAVEPMRGSKYRIRLIASTSAVKKILSIWGDHQPYVLNGKKRRT